MKTLRTLTKALLLVAAAVPAHAQDAQGGQVTGPYVVSPMLLNTTQGSATISWLEKGPAINLRQGDIRETNFPLRVNKATFTHLTPGSVHSYNAGPAGQGSFKVPPIGAEPFEFLIYAESRNGAVANALEQHSARDGNDVHRRLISLMAKENPDFVMHLGDAVQTGTDQSEWFNFFQIGAPLFRKTSLFLTYGNHEQMSPLTKEIFDHRKSYYSFNWGTTHFIVLDSEYDRLRQVPVQAMHTEKEKFWNEQLAWLKEELEANKHADHIFVTFHLPAYTATAYKRLDRSFRIQKEWVPLFEEYGVTVLNGHEHNYQRHKKNGVHYVVGGSAGASLEKVDWPLKGITQKALSEFSYSKIRVDGRSITLQTFGIDSRKIDEAKIK